MRIVLTIFMYFFIYSIIGWVVESFFVMINTKKFVDRGFLIGPYCPIYGSGSILMIMYLTQYKDNILTVFILGLVICSLLEYLTSYFMEVLFKTRWWDYSDQKFNLNGRICGQNCLLFGLGGIIVIYFIQPTLTNIFSSIPNNVLAFISVFSLIVFSIDFLISLNVINKFKKTLTSVGLKKDSTQEFANAVKESIIRNNKFLQERLINAFPNINFNKLISIKNEIKEEIEEFINKIDD